MMRRHLAMRTTRWPGGAPHRDWSGHVRVRGAVLLVAWIDFLSHIPWELLVTLTFDPKKAFPVNRDLAGREAFEWCGLLARTVRRPVAYVIALERHRSGQFHAHVLLVGTGGDISGPAAMWTQR